MSESHRFFIPPDWIQGDFARLQGPVVHQIAHVLRLAVGDTIALLDDSGWEYRARLDSLSGHSAAASIAEKRLVAEPRVRVSLYQGVLKADRFEMVLQKGTELGVSRLVPVLCQRCVALPSERKGGRWERIVREAAEQSGRGRLPMVSGPASFEHACQQVQGLSLMPWEEATGLSLRQALSESGRPDAINLFIGPEGGFGAEEVGLARSHGIVPVTLGKRILRAETAALAAVAAVMYELGEMEV